MGEGSLQLLLPPGAWGRTGHGLGAGGAAVGAGRCSGPPRFGVVLQIAFLTPYLCLEVKRLRKIKMCHFKSDFASSFSVQSVLSIIQGSRKG